MNTPIIFNGSIPQNYQDYLTPFLFDPYAEDLLQRVELNNTKNVLELACGTGCVTNRLLEHLPSASHLFATDLEADMLTVAKRGVTDSNITWNTVDMTSIPYNEEQFDLIVCQFGVMLVPEKLKALKEMNRVLKKGGQLIFNVWGSVHSNQVWHISGKVIESFIGVNPILSDPGPFSMTEYTTVRLLKDAGFNNVMTTTVDKTGTIETAAMAAKGFIEGLPVFMAISRKDSLLVPKIQEALERELIKQLGNQPLRSSLQALVFQTTK